MYGCGWLLVNRRLTRHEFELGAKKMNDVCGEELKRKEGEQQKKILYATGHDDVCRESMHVLSFSF